MVATVAQQARAFGRRLTQEMLAQGYVAKRASIKADAVILQKKSGVKSLEMARRYIKGESMPKSPKIIRNICSWLNLTEAYLLRGEMPKRPEEAENQVTVIMDSAILADCLKQTLTIAEKYDLDIAQDVIANITTFLYMGAVKSEIPPSEAQVLEMMKVFNRKSES